MVCNWPWFGRTVTGLYCNRVRIGAERFALKVHSLCLYSSLASFSIVFAFQIIIRPGEGTMESYLTVNSNNNNIIINL